MSILLCPTKSAEYCDYAEKLLRLFVDHFEELYERNMLVYNIHCLLHLANETRLFGPLDRISAFPFENFMQALKKMV